MPPIMRMSRHKRGVVHTMWQGFDPEIRRDLAAIKALFSLSSRTPSREWPLIFVGEYDAMLVVREWPGGHLTAYWTSEIRDTLTGDRGTT
jgi:hypothetical protein